MKKCRKMAALFIVCLLILCGCGNRDYTTEDAERYKADKDDQLIDMTDVGDDTVWTYREANERGLCYHVIEDHYTTSFDATWFEQSRMYSDYENVVTGYYIRDLRPLGTVTGGAENEETHETEDFCLSYEVADRNGVEETLSDAKRIFSALKRENRKYSSETIKHLNITISVQFQWLEQEFDWDVGSRKFKDAETDILRYAIICQDRSYISQYTKKDIKKVILAQDSHILLDKGNGWEKTKYITLRGNTYMYPSAFFYLLKDEGFSPEGTPAQYTVTGKDGVTYSFKGDEFTKLSFLQMGDILGCKVQDQYNL